MAEIESSASSTEPTNGVTYLDDVVDVHSATPYGRPCSACGAPVEADDRFCPACGQPNNQDQAPIAADEEARQKRFRCENCGAEVATDPDQRSYVCAFCDSTYVVELDPEQSQRQRPEFVIGFAVTPEKAEEIFRKWIRAGGWFRPSDLAIKMAADKMKGVYLPFWSFSMLAESRWSANIGEYWYRTETYTTRDSKGNLVTKTRQVRETEWWPLSGRHHRYYSGYLISGSQGLPQREADRIKPFQLPALKRYQPYFLAGWLCEEYSIDREEALKRCYAEFHRRQQQNIQGFLPGDTHSQLELQTRFSQESSDLCLLPIYLLSYRYQDRVYRFMINGQTGKAAGNKPFSWKRLWLAVGGVIAGLLVIGGVIALLSAVIGG